MVKLKFMCPICWEIFEIDSEEIKEDTIQCPHCEEIHDLDEEWLWSFEFERYIKGDKNERI